MQDFGLEDVAWALGSLVIVSIIGILWRERAVIVSSLSRGWATSLDRARQQKAAREELYGYVQSGELAESHQNGTGSVGPVLSQQNQESQNQNATFEMFADYLSEHNLSDEQLITVLALLRRLNGDDLLSANKIRDTVGGADATVKALIAPHRKPRPRPKPPARLDRPPNGWQVKNNAR